MTYQRLVRAGFVLALWLFCSSISGAETHHVSRFFNSSGSPRKLRTMAFSPDGSTLAVSTASNRLSFVRTRDGETVTEFNQTPFSISYSKDGSRLFMISESKRVLLDSRSIEPIEFDYNANVSDGYLGVSFEIRSGKILVKALTDGGPVSAAGKINVGDEVTGVGEGRGGGIKRVLGFSLDKVIELLQGDAGSYVRLEVIPKGQFKAVVHTIRRQAAERKNGRLVFVPVKSAPRQEPAVWCMSDNQHEFSDSFTGAIISAFKPVDLQDVGQVTVSPDGRLFAIVAKRRDREGDGIEVFDIQTRERVLYAPFPGASWYQLRFSADASKLLIGTRDTVEILDVKSSKYEDALTLGWNPSDGDTPRAGGTGGAAKRSVGKTLGIDLNRSRRRSPRQLLRCLAVSAQNVVATGDPFGAVRVWDMATGEKLREFVTGYDEHIEAVEFSPKGKWLAFYVKGELHLVDAYDLRSKDGATAKTDPASEPPEKSEKPMPVSKVFKTSNGAEIRVTFDGPATDAEIKKALAEVLKKMDGDK